MATTRPGPTSVNFAYTGTAYHSIGDLWNRRDLLIDLHSEHKERVDVVTHVVNGEWYHVWPNLTNTPEAPTVANIVEMGVNHWASVGGAMLPSVKVPVDISDNRSQGKRGARKRERRLREVIKDSNLGDIASLLWGDYAGAGTAVLGAWCDFHLPPEERNPYIVRYDPRHTYSTLDERGNVTELLVARRVPKIEAVARYPELQDTFTAVEGDVEEWHWYTKDKFYHIFADVSAKGREKQRHYVIAEMENPMGFVPVVEVVRPSFDGQRRGLFDQTLHLLRTMHRLMTLTIASTEENAFPPMLEYDTINPEDFGPGATISARSAEARLERIGPASHFDIKDLVARLAEDARGQSAFPQQLTGDPGASIASARAISASMGQLDARLALAHRQFEVGFSKLFGFLLALDEMFCNTERTIVGDHRDAGMSAESWLPERDINGAWYAEATYGIGAGSDPANVEVRLSMHLANGIISQESYRQNLPFLEDPDKEPLLILREQIRTALVTGLAEQAAQGQIEGAAYALQLLSTDDVDYDEVVGKLVEFLAPPEQPGGEAGAGDPALAALQGAESLARGGIPGNAAQAPDPGGLGLPPLSQIMEQDARMVS